MSSSSDSLVRMINQIAANSMGAHDLKSSNLTSELNAVAAQALAAL